MSGLEGATRLEGHLRSALLQQHAGAPQALLVVARRSEARLLGSAHLQSRNEAGHELLVGRAHEETPAEAVRCVCAVEQQVVRPQCLFGIAFP